MSHFQSTLPRIFATDGYTIPSNGGVSLPVYLPRVSAIVGYTVASEVAAVALPVYLPCVSAIAGYVMAFKVAAVALPDCCHVSAMVGYAVASGCCRTSGLTVVTFLP